MAQDKTIKISEQAHSALDEYKEENGHKSFDSAIRELVQENKRLTNELDVLKFQVGE